MSEPTSREGDASDLRLSTDKLTRIIGRRHVLRDIRFEAHGGEVVALIGRNGAGKTTLLSLLSGRIRPDRGSFTIEAGGRALAGHETSAVVGFLPHDLFLYPDLTTRENLLFFAALHAVPHAKERVGGVLESIGLPRDADRPVRTLSRGMQQSAAIGRLMMVGARIWLLDEPTTGLDEPGRRWLSQTLTAQGREGRLIIMASHHRDEVAGTASRIVVVDGGRIVHDGPAGEDGVRAAFSRVDGGAA